MLFVYDLGYALTSTLHDMSQCQHCNPTANQPTATKLPADRISCRSSGLGLYVTPVGPKHHNTNIVCTAYALTHYVNRDVTATATSNSLSSRADTNLDVLLNQSFTTLMDSSQQKLFCTRSFSWRHLSAKYNFSQAVPTKSHDKLLKPELSNKIRLTANSSHCDNLIARSTFNSLFTSTNSSLGRFHCTQSITVKSQCTSQIMTP